jgi:hypothetical protein
MEKPRKRGGLKEIPTVPDLTVNIFHKCNDAPTHNNADYRTYLGYLFLHNVIVVQDCLPCSLWSKYSETTIMKKQ